MDWSAAQQKLADALKQQQHEQKKKQSLGDIKKIETRVEVERAKVREAHFERINENLQLLDNHWKRLESEVIRTKDELKDINTIFRVAYNQIKNSCNKLYEADLSSEVRFRIVLDRSLRCKENYDRLFQAEADRLLAKETLYSKSKDDLNEVMDNLEAIYDLINENKPIPENFYSQISEQYQTYCSEYSHLLSCISASMLPFEDYTVYENRMNKLTSFITEWITQQSNISKFKEQAKKNQKVYSKPPKRQKGYSLKLLKYFSSERHEDILHQ